MSEPEQWPDENPGDFEDSSGSGIPPFLLDPAGVFRRRWPWMLATLTLGVIAAVGVTSTWKHRFEAQAKVVINSQQIPKEFVRSTVAESSLAYVNAAVGKALARANLDRIIDEVGLYEEAKGRVLRDALITRLRSHIIVAPERSVSARGGQGSIIYGLAFEADDPEHAADVANALAALLLKATLEQRTDQARSVTRFLRQALEEDERELRALSQQLSEFRRVNRGQLPSDLNTNLRKLDLRQERRVAVSAELAQMTARLEGVGSLSPRLQTENEALLNDLRRQLAGELAAHTEDHPNVVSLRRQVQSFEAAVASEQAEGSGASPVRAAAERQIALLRQKLRDLDAEMDELSERIDQIPAVAERLAALEQKESVLREDYLSSLRKVEDAELAETLEVAQHGAHIEILERARPPTSPKQSRWLILAGGLVASLLLGLGIGVLFELLDPVLLVGSQLEKVVGRPVLGSLPRVST